MSKKVLIVYASAGMGHVMAAKALEEAFADKYPGVEVRVVDLIDYAMKVYKNIFVHGYNFLSEKVPPGWGLFYNYLDTRYTQKIADILSKVAMESKFFPFLREYKPSFIISTYPLATRLISLSKHRDIIDIPSAMVITDFGFHSFWIDKETNYYFVANEELRKKVIEAGIRPDAVIATGIPIRPQFTKSIDVNKVLERLGFNKKYPTFFILGGMCKYQILIDVIQKIKKTCKNIQIIIVAGRDEELKKSLDASDLRMDTKIKIFGFVKNIEEYMASSDLIFSKAGGLTVSECLAMGVPMIIHKIIPGQEEGNVKYLVENNAGIKADSVSDLIVAASDLMSNPQKLAEMKKACRRLGKPDAAARISEFVYDRIQ